VSIFLDSLAWTVPRKSHWLGLVNPFVALVVSFGFLGLMLYKRVNLGITLNVTALLLALLSLDLQSIPTIVYETTVGSLTVAVVLATFGIMLLSQLYKETKVINSLSDSASKVINNSKVCVQHTSCCHRFSSSCGRSPDVGALGGLRG